MQGPVAPDMPRAAQRVDGGQLPQVYAAGADHVAGSPGHHQEGSEEGGGLGPAYEQDMWLRSDFVQVRLASPLLSCSASDLFVMLCGQGQCLHCRVHVARLLAGGFAGLQVADCVVSKRCSAETKPCIHAPDAVAACAEQCD